MITASEFSLLHAVFSGIVEKELGHPIPLPQEVREATGVRDSLPGQAAPESCAHWLALLDLSLADLPPINLAHLPAEPGAAEAPPVNPQTRAIFQDEAATIAEGQRHLVWLTPSRDEDAASPVVRTEDPDIVVSADDAESLEGGLPIAIQGGRERGVNGEAGVQAADLEDVEHVGLGRREVDRAGRVPLGEELAHRIWEALVSRISQGRLSRIHLVQSRDLAFDCCG